MDLRQEEGSATIEAIIALTAFMFAMTSLIMLIQLVMVQTLLQNAINQTAKEISQDTYLYKAFGLLNVKQDTSESNEQISKSINKTQEDLKTLLSAFLDGGNISEVNEDIDTQFQCIKSNLASGAVYMGFRGIENIVCNNIFKKYVTADGNKNTADINLKRYHIIGGCSGLDFSSSKVLDDKENIILIVKYSVKVFSPLGGFREVRCRQVASTRGWVGSNEKKS